MQPSEPLPTEQLSNAEPAGVETAPPTLRHLAIKAARDWSDSLIDRSGRNELLNCRERGKLILDQAKPEAVARLLHGQPVRLRSLFGGDALVGAAKTAELIRRRIKEYDEERGVRVGRLVQSFATWRDPKAERTPCAPVLLREVTVTRKPGMDELELVADNDLEINPVLLHYLRTTFRVEVDPALIADLNDEIDVPEQVEGAIAKLWAALDAVPGLQIAPGNLIGTFHYAKLAMHQDLVDHAPVFAENDLFAAMAGDLDAIESIRRPMGEVSVDQPDFTPPSDEFLVLDADPSQHLVVNAAVAGRNLVVQGPPGTGKSQTISNLIASLAAQGKTVLFVAEKRAAIEAVLGRLNRVGLGDLTLDLHVTTANKARVYEQFRTVIANSRRVPPFDVARQDARLDRLRRTLIQHDSALHIARQPWGVSVNQAQIALTESPVDARTPVRFAGPELGKLHGEAADEIRDQLIELWVLGGLGSSDGAGQLGPWVSAGFLDDAAATRARDLTHALRDSAPQLEAQSTALAATTGLASPANAEDATSLLAWAERTAAINSRWRPEIYDQALGDLLAATGDKNYRIINHPDMGWWARRRTLRLVKALHIGHFQQAQAHADIIEAQEVRAEWQRLTGGAPPYGFDPAPACAAQAAAAPALAELSAALQRNLGALSWPELRALLNALAQDPNAPHRAARMNRLRAALAAAGLGELLTWISAQLPEWPDEKRSELIGDSFDHAWNASILDLTQASDAHLASFDGAAHSNVAAEYVAADHAHLDDTRHRVLRLVAERLTDVRSANRAQDLFLDRELDKKRRLKTLRELMREAPDVLLAAKPCWAMSPLLVSQLLPPERIFDVVIFDEASQVQPAEAMPSMARARTAVIAGDSKQLPPTTFFESALEASDDDLPADEADTALTVDVESVLEAFNRALGQSLASEHYLGWHYRSQDARLIAPSNSYFYGDRMTMFPGVEVAPPIEFVHVPDAESAQGTSAAEVARVVNLMLAHASNRPNESLGVITMGISHADAIERALQLRLRDEPALRGWFDESGDEPYFIKNLERVQGDERDAIILAVGYGKSGGRMMHRFGPLNNAGGERRLNVAITRAKKRMTVVAGFLPDDLQADKLRAEGARRLADFLRYAASGCQTSSGAVRGASELNPFEIQVRNRLLAAGVNIECKWGVAGDVIEFAAKHPTTPDRMVLAIESDGAAYHAAPTTRARDRLRREQLERLGWKYHRIWSTEWFRRPDSEVTRIRQAYDMAVAAADGVAEPGVAEPAVAEPAIAAPDMLEPGVVVRSVIEPDLASGADLAEPEHEEPKPAEPELFDEDVLEFPARGQRPTIETGKPIVDYLDRELVAMIDWIESDGQLRTDDELLREVRDELGLNHGSRIDARIESAIQTVRGNPAPAEVDPSQPANSTYRHT